MGDYLSKRESGLELFRCFLMFLIVLWHCFRHGIFYDTFANTDICILITVALCWHVDGFVAISGWFGIRFSMRKLLRLYGIIVFYSVVSTVAEISAGCAVGVTTFKISGGWFGDSYMALLLLSPLINASLDNLQVRPLLQAWLAFAVVATLTWMPGHLFCATAAFGCASASLFSLVFVYVTSRTFALCCLKLDEVPCLKKLLPFIKHWKVIVIIMFIAYALVAYWAPRNRYFNMDWWACYYGPFVVCMALAMMKIFSQIRMSGMLERIVRCCAPSMFGVLLFHDVTYLGHLTINKMESYLATSMSPTMTVVLSAIAIFLLGIIIDGSRRALLNGVRLLWRKTV